jgi:hypothetical protein
LINSLSVVYKPVKLINSLSACRAWWRTKSGPKIRSVYMTCFHIAFCFFYAAENIYNAVNQIYQALRTNTNNQTTSRTSHLLSLPTQCSLSNMKIPAYWSGIPLQIGTSFSRQVSWVNPLRS